MTDRDHFAAAALTGLLAQGDDGSFSEESYARAAYRWADVILSERERTNHDALPAAIAQTDSATGEPGGGHGSDGTDKPVTRPVLGTGNTQKPVAWAADIPGKFGGSPTMLFGYTKNLVKSIAAAGGDVVEPFPLYRRQRPTLTDAEREAMDTAEASLLRESTDLNAPLLVRKRLGAAAATLRGLLERLK